MIYIWNSFMQRRRHKKMTDSDEIFLALLEMKSMIDEYNSHDEYTFRWNKIGRDYCVKQIAKWHRVLKAFESPERDENGAVHCGAVFTCYDRYRAIREAKEAKEKQEADAFRLKHNIEAAMNKKH